MTSRVGVWLAALILAPAGSAFAQPAPPIDAGRSVRRPETALTTRPRFQVEAVGFRAHNETGWDFLGSDEVIAVFDTGTYRVMTDTFGDVDGGESRTFRDGQTCISPATDNSGGDRAWSCAPNGAAGPVSFIAALYEYDGVRFPAGFCVHGGDATDLLPPQSTDCRVDGEVAVLIGRRPVRLNVAELVAAMPRVGDAYNGSVSLFGGCDGDCVSGGTFGPSPDYTLRYRIVRMNDEIVTPPRNPTPR
ncbi:MAG: hypothetical protein KBC34_04030 [Phenylobacterium sp.]|nr:hypothetical protein [Phenylobacterium sp.]